MRCSCATAAAAATGPQGRGDGMAITHVVPKQTLSAGQSPQPGGSVERMRETCGPRLRAAAETGSEVGSRRKGVERDMAF